MYFLCEIEDANNVIKIALPKNKIIGISINMIKSNNLYYNFALFNNKLYPILTHANLKKPKLKFFLIFEKFAFGITRIIKESKNEKIEIVEKELYNGVIIDENEEYYIYNLDKLVPPQEINYLKKEVQKQNKKKKHFIVIDNQYAIYINKIKTILTKKELINFPVNDFIGFVEYQKFIPIKLIKPGKFIIVLDNIGFQCSNIQTINGEVIEGKDEKILVSELGKFKIVE